MEKKNEKKKTSQTKYQMRDGKVFTASSATDLVEQMRAASYQASKDVQEFMGNVSENSYYYNHSNIRTDSPENFVEDLIAGKLVRKVE